MRAYVIDIMVVLTIFPVILQTVINVIMLSVGGQGGAVTQAITCNATERTGNVTYTVSQN